ncbi:MAG: DUF922 domain-containing protein [Sphingomicrobium sp.]
MLNFLILASASMIQMGSYSLPPAPPPTMPPARPQTPTPAPAAQPAPPPLATIAAVSGRGLKDLPNTTIRYYDVTGKNLKEVKKSIDEQLAAKDAAGHSVAPPAGWEIEAGLQKRTVDGKCTVASAHAKFIATATLPRLVTEQSLKPNEQAVWHTYLANVDTTQAASLWFAHDHAPDIEKAILASSCEGAQAAGTAAIDRLKQQVVEFQQTYAAAHAPK